MKKLIIVVFLLPALLFGQVSFIREYKTNAHIADITKPLELSSGNFICAIMLAANNIWSTHLYLFSECGDIITNLQISASPDILTISNFFELASGDVLVSARTADFITVHLVLDPQTLGLKSQREHHEAQYITIEKSIEEDGIIYQAGSAFTNIFSSRMNINLRRNLHLYKDYYYADYPNINVVDFLHYSQHRLYTHESYDHTQKDKQYSIIHCLDEKLRDQYLISSESEEDFSIIDETVGFLGTDTVLIGVVETDAASNFHYYIRKYYRDSLLYQREVPNQIQQFFTYSTCLYERGILKCINYNGEIAWYNTFGEQIFYTSHLVPLLNEGDMLLVSTTKDGGLFSVNDGYTGGAGKLEPVLKIIKTTIDYEISDIPHPKCMVNVDEAGENDGISLYPNPGQGSLHIVSKEIVHKYHIFNTTSELLMTGNPERENFTIMSDLIPGAYIIHLETSKGLHVRQFTVIR